MLAPSFITNSTLWTIDGNINNNGYTLTAGGNPVYYTAINGQISGVGGLTVASGNLYLTGTNTYTGGTLVSGGALVVDTTNPGGVLPGNVTNNSILTFGIANNTTHVYNSTISGSGTVNKSQPGTLVLGGNNTYSGTTTVVSGGGALQITTPRALGTGNIALTKAGLVSGTLQLALTGVNVITNTFAGFNSTTTFGGGGSADIENVSGNNTITSALSVTGTASGGLTVQSDAGLLTLAGTIGSTNASQVVDLGGAGNGLISAAVVDGMPALDLRWCKREPALGRLPEPILTLATLW